MGLGEGLGRSGRLVLEAVCSDSWVWRRSGRWVWEEVWEVGSVAIPGFGGGLGRPYVAIPGFGGSLRR